MRVDFYHLTRDPAEAVVPLLADKLLAVGERVLVVADDAGALARISDALWQYQRAPFLAHGVAGGPHDARQPILLSPDPVATNGARTCVLADGQWRDVPAMARLFLLFTADHLEAARQTWRALGQREGVDRHYWRQDRGKWLEGPDQGRKAPATSDN